MVLFSGYFAPVEILHSTVEIADLPENRYKSALRNPNILK